MDEADNIYWVYGIVLEEGIQADNKTVQKLLAQEGIGSRTFFWCMHEQPVYRKMGLFHGEQLHPFSLLAAPSLLYLLGFPCSICPSPFYEWDRWKK